MHIVSGVESVINAFVRRVHQNGNYSISDHLPRPERREKSLGMSKTFPDPYTTILLVHTRKSSSNHWALFAVRDGMTEGLTLAP